MQASRDSDPDGVLIIGLPRSGTTWISELLALAEGVELVVEPDNERTSLLAVAAKRDLPRFPALQPGQRHAAFERLWLVAFRHRLGPLLSRSILTRAWFRPRRPCTARAVARKEQRVVAGPGQAGRGLMHRWLAGRTPPPHAPRGQRVVKTVHAPLCAEWVASVAQPRRVVIVQRHPLAVLASLRRMAMPDIVREGCFIPALWRGVFGDDGPSLIDRSSPIAEAGSQAALLTAALEQATQRHDDWLALRHESLCEDPVAGFRQLYEQLGLAWTPRVAEAIQQRDRPGTGYRTQRLAREQVDKWRGEFNARELDILRRLLQRCGLGHWLAEHSTTPAATPDAACMDAST